MVNIKKIISVITVSSALGLGFIGSSNLNAQAKSGWHTPKHGLNVAVNNKYWSSPHYVKTAYKVKAYNISSKGVMTADNYSIGSKIVPKGTVLKGVFATTTPGGFEILSGKGFSPNTKYQKEHEAIWVIYPYNAKHTNTAKYSTSTNWISKVK